MPLPIDQSQTVSAMARGRFTSEVGWGSHSGLWPEGMTPIQLQTRMKRNSASARGTNSRPAGPMTESVRSWIWSTTVS